MGFCRSYRPLWLTSNSFEFPNYTILGPNMNKQVALILYYAQVMDQKKISKDFFSLCKDSFENKFEEKALESAVKTWIRHSIVRLHRRREQIISNAVTSIQTDMIRTISHILLDIFCDLLQESRGKASYLNALSKKRTSAASDTNHCVSTLFSENGVLFHRTSKSMDFSACTSGWDRLFLSLPFQESQNLTASVFNKNPFDWLHKLWLTFSYQPDPANSICNSDTAIQMASSDHVFQTSFDLAFQTSMYYQSYILRKTTAYSQNLKNYIIEADDIDLSCMVLKLTSSNLMNHNKAYYSRAKTDQAVPTRESSDDLSSILSQKDSDSSDSWSFTDFAEEDDSKSCIDLDMRSPAMSWLQSSSSRCIEADFDSDDDCIVFGDVITEENCMERGGTNGSLYFIDTDDDDDFDVMFSESSAVISFPNDTYEAKSQGYVNPCFEDEIRSFSVPKYIRTINECWSEMMLGVECKPRQASKVSFAPESSLVTIHCFEKTEENSYEPSAILDRMRFHRRIQELNYLLAPFFTCEHRKEIERRNGFYQD